MNPFRGGPRARAQLFSMAIALSLLTMGLGGLAGRAGAAVQSSVRANPSSQMSATASAGFRLLPGAANDVAQGPERGLFVIGTNPLPDGFGIYGWNGTAWHGINGAGVTIAVAADGDPLVINSAHRVFERIQVSPGVLGWLEAPGTLNDIAVNQNNVLWGIGTNPLPDGFGIYRWTGTAWVGLPGAGVKIAVAPNGDPIVVNSAHQAYAWDGHGWLPLPGRVTDIAEGPDGALWGVGTNPVNGGFGVYLFTSRGWVGVPGGAVDISVGPTGLPAVVNSSHHIYVWAG